MLLLVLLNHVKTLRFRARSFQRRELRNGTPHILLLLTNNLFMGRELSMLLLTKFISSHVRFLHLRGVVTLNDGILLEIKEVIVLLRVIEVIAILFDNRLLVIALVVHLVGRIHLVIDESLPLKEVLTPLLLLHQLLRLAIAGWNLLFQPFFEFLHESHNLK